MGIQVVMGIDGHDWKERVTYHGAPSFQIERHPGELLCYTCGLEKRAGEPVARKCHDVWSEKTGIPAIGGESHE